jgi:HlyD family secretion protein
MVNAHLEPDIAHTLGTARASRRRQWLTRAIVAVLVALAVAAAAVAWRSMSATNGPRYTTQKARRESLIVTVTATGTLQPTNQVDVSSELSGIITSVEVDYNDRVRVGQILAQLDQAKLKAQVLQSRASLESARAKLLQAQATVTEAGKELARLKRARELSGNRIPSQHDLDAAAAVLERANADEANNAAAVRQAQAILEANETDLAKTVIYSPISGIVLKRSIEPGQTVASSLQAPVLFTLAEDLANMELHVDVDEADVGKVKPGQGATFTVDAYPDRAFQARITQVRFGSKTVSGVVTYETVLRVDNSDLSLRPGMTATANIAVLHVRNAILVPSAALRFTPPAPDEKKPSGGLVASLLPRPPATPAKPREESAADKKQQRVWTLKDGQPTVTPVTVGATDGIWTEVVAGDITPGTSLLIDAVVK